MSPRVIITIILYLSMSSFVLAQPQEGFNPGTYEDLYGTWPDLIPPSVSVTSPNNNARVTPGSFLNVTIAASDTESDIAQVQVVCDLDGNGDETGPKERQTAKATNTPNEYKAVIGPFTGPPGQRELHAIAKDTATIYSATKITLHIGAENTKQPK